MYVAALDLSDLVLPLSLIAGGVILGSFFDIVLLGKIRRKSKTTQFKSLSVVADSLKGMVFVWFALAGLYGATINTEMNADLLNIVRKLMLLAAIMSVSFVIARLSADFIILFAERASGMLPSASIIANIIKISVIVLGCLVSMQSLGISIAPVLTAFGVGGIAVALALQDTLSNLFAGIQILASGQVAPGDYIRLESGDEGYVTDVGWKNTTIKALPNNIAIIPNNRLSSSIITNFSRPEKEMSIIIGMGVNYKSDLKKVERVTKTIAEEVLSEIEGGVSGFEPLIRFHTFGAYSIEFSVVLRVKEFTSRYLITHEFITRLKKRYEEEGIEIPYPITTIEFPQEN